MDPTAHPHVTREFAERRLPAIDGGFAFHFAAEYFDRGWSVLPLSGKRPAVPSWRDFQSTRATLNQLQEWFGSGNANVGIITGAVSGLVVVDCDTPGDAVFWRGQFPPTPLEVTTGRGGSHFYYRYPDGEEVCNRAGLLQRHIDLRAQGGYVVAPPSRHPNGARYRWLGGDEYCLDEVPHFSPAWIAAEAAEAPVAATKDIRHPRNYIRSIRAVSGQGGHNQTFRAACKLRDAGLSPEEALCELVVWNGSNASPPWSAHELLHKVKSAYQQGRVPRNSSEGSHE